MRFALTTINVSCLQDNYITIFLPLPNDDFSPGPSFGDLGLDPTEHNRYISRFILIILNQFFWFRAAFIERQDHLVMFWLPKQVEVNHKQLRQPDRVSIMRQPSRFNAYGSPVCEPDPIS